MNKTLFAFLLCLFPSFCLGAFTWNGATVSGINGATVSEWNGITIGGSPPSYQLYENLDGINACFTGDASFVNCLVTNVFQSSPTCNLKSTAGLPDGTYNAECTNTEFAFINVTNNAETWITFKFSYEVEATQASTILLGYDPSAVALFNFNIRGDLAGDKLYGFFQSTSTGYVEPGLTEDTSYYVKIRYKADDGPNNAEMEVWQSSDGTTWGTSKSATANNPNASQLNSIRLYSNDTASGQANYYDCVKVDNSDITNATCGN